MFSLACTHSVPFCENSFCVDAYKIPFIRIFVHRQVYLHTEIYCTVIVREMCAPLEAHIRARLYAQSLSLCYFVEYNNVGMCEW